jgi:cell division initiation protein
MPITPVEVRHLQMRRGLFGYSTAGVGRAMDEIADSFEGVWRERAELYERVEALETELHHHVELEQLLRSTLVAAERAAQEMRETARREAEVIVTEANAQARRVLRDALAEKERILTETRRIRALLRSALTVVEEARVEEIRAAEPAVATDVTQLTVNAPAAPAHGESADSEAAAS